MRGPKGERGYPGRSAQVPNIVLKPSNIAVKERSTAAFVCKASGYPEPQITWKLNGKVLPKMKITNKGLEINNVKKADEGVVTCLAKSILGEATARASLTVLGEYLKYKVSSTIS